MIWEVARVGGLGTIYGGRRAPGLVAGEESSCDVGTHHYAPQSTQLIDIYVYPGRIFQLS